jgi:hypothetical protein
MAGCGRHRRSRRRTRFLLRAALVLASVAGAALAGAALAHPGSESQRTIRFLEIARTAPQLVDHNGNGQPDIGDALAGASDVFRWEGSRRGGRLGHIWRLCILATRTTGNCAATVFLSDGTVRIYGYVDFDRAPDELAVIGGTGAYLGMRGSFTVQPLGGQGSTRSSDFLRLR